MAGGVAKNTVSNTASRRRRRRELGVSAWLRAGALSVGIGAAVLGSAGAAHADRGDDASGGTAHRASSVHASDRGGSAQASDRGGNVQGPDTSAGASRPARGPAAARAATGGATAPADVPPATGDNSDSSDAADSSGGAVSDVDVEAPRPAAASAVTAPAVKPGASTPVTTSPAVTQVPAPKASANAGETGWKPGSVISIFVSDGTLTHPDAGVLIGNGFSYTAVSCATGTKCNGGQAGLLYGNGGNGWNGGNGGNAGLMGNGGNGGSADRFTPFVDGGNGGRAGLFWGNGGNGGNASTGANGGDGGKGGLFGGVGGNGGVGGPGAVLCSDPKCQVTQLGGKGGDGARGGLIFGTNGRDGAAPLPLDSQLFVGYNPVYPVTSPDGKPEINTNGTGAAYPNDNDPAKPYAVPGTVVASVQLPAGFEVGRFGYPTGGYLAPVPTYFAQLSLPPSNQVSPYFRYVVKDPAALPPGYRIEQSQVAPWFGQPGGGIQYRIIFTDATGKETTGSVQALLDTGYLGYK